MNLVTNLPSYDKLDGQPWHKERGSHYEQAECPKYPKYKETGASTD